MATVWYSTEEIARILGMSPSWVRKQILDSRLTAVAWTASGSRCTYRVQQVWLDDFIRKYRTAPEDLMR